MELKCVFAIHAGDYGVRITVCGAAAPFISDGNSLCHQHLEYSITHEGDLFKVVRQIREAQVVQQ